MLERDRWGGSGLGAVARVADGRPIKNATIKDQALDLLAHWQRFERESDLSVCEELQEMEAWIAKQRCQDLEELEVQLILVAAYAEYLDDAVSSDESRILIRLSRTALDGLAGLREISMSETQRDTSLDELKRLCLSGEVHRSQA
ncbi:MAG: hypothetical protein MI920_03280 [Kiloniellales bacterium]|nr:hypothetical protein [Kiloniellales bacterium]